MSMTLSVIAGNANAPLAADIARRLGTEPRRRILDRFADAELQVEIEESVRGHDVYLIQPTSPPADRHLLELILLADACRRAGAARLTGVLPYFGYARHDRRARGREPVGARVVAGLLEGAGFDRVVAVDLHTPAIEGCFRIPLEHLSAVSLLAEALRPVMGERAVLVAPDLGAVKLARRYQRLLDLPVAVVHKARTGSAQVALEGLIGDVAGRTPVIVDDMITTAGTVEAAVHGLLDAGAVAPVIVAATHPVLAGPALDRLHGLPIQRIFVTDSIAPPDEVPVPLQVVSVSALLAETIARLHEGQSLDRLLTHG
jgi:ribose-phosphate pyrophosphokinase